MFYKCQCSFSVDTVAELSGSKCVSTRKFKTAKENPGKMFLITADEPLGNKDKQDNVQLKGSSPSVDANLEKHVNEDISNNGTYEEISNSGTYEDISNNGTYELSKNNRDTFLNIDDISKVSNASIGKVGDDDLSAIDIEDRDEIINEGTTKTGETRSLQLEDSYLAVPSSRQSFNINKPTQTPFYIIPTSFYPLQHTHTPTQPFIPHPHHILHHLPPPPPQYLSMNKRQRETFPSLWARASHPR